MIAKYSLKFTHYWSDFLSKIKMSNQKQHKQQESDNYEDGQFDDADADSNEERISSRYDKHLFRYIF